MKILIHIISFLLISSLEAVDLSEKLDNFVKDLMACRDLPGLQVVVVESGEVVHSRGYGYSDLEQRDEVNEDTVFCIGSLTKAFTATVAYGELHRRGYSMDTPLRDIFGDSLRQWDQYRTNHVTMRDLLSHRTGVPGYFGGLMVGIDVGREEAVSRLRYMPPTHRLAETYNYNNLMYLLAGHVTERLSADTWENLVRERIFKKLKMQRTSFIENLPDLKNWAKSYTSYNGTTFELPIEALSMVKPAGPAGSICSSATDMAKWLIFNLNYTDPTTSFENRNGPYPDLSNFLSDLHTPQILTPPNHKTMTKPEWPLAGFRYAYNLGWGSGLYRGYKDVNHAGHVSGYRSLIELFPDQSLGIYIITNGPNSVLAGHAINALQYYISDLYLKLEPWLNGSVVCQFPEPWTQSNVEPAKAVSFETFKPDFLWRIKLEKFTGKFGHLAFGNITIYLNKTTGFLNLKQGRLAHGVLYPQKKELLFKLEFVGVLEFVTKEDGSGVFYDVFFYQENGDINYLSPGYLENNITFSRKIKNDTVVEQNGCKSCCVKAYFHSWIAMVVILIHIVLRFCGVP